MKKSYIAIILVCVIIFAILGYLYCATAGGKTNVLETMTTAEREFLQSQLRQASPDTGTPDTDTDEMSGMGEIGTEMPDSSEDESSVPAVPQTFSSGSSGSSSSSSSPPEMTYTSETSEPSNQSEIVDSGNTTVNETINVSQQQQVGNTVGTSPTVVSVTPSSTSASSSSSIPDSQVDNYNYYQKSGVPLIYYGPSGSVAKIITVNNKYVIEVISSDGTVTTYSVSGSTPISGSGKAQVLPSNFRNTRFIDQAGDVAKIFMTPGGQYAIEIKLVNGEQYIYTPNNIYSYDRNNAKSFVIGQDINGQTTINHLANQNNQLISNIQSGALNRQPYNYPMPGMGIPGNQIPPGQQDLYILKSQVVPPVCPKCPTICSTNKEKNCPPCPACARCPPTSDNFTCKKVPDYTKPISNFTRQTQGDSEDYGSSGNSFSSLPMSTSVTTAGPSSTGANPTQNNLTDAAAKQTSSFQDLQDIKSGFIDPDNNDVKQKEDEVLDAKYNSVGGRDVVGTDKYATSGSAYAVAGETPGGFQPEYQNGSGLGVRKFNKNTPIGAVASGRDSEYSNSAVPPTQFSPSGGVDEDDSFGGASSSSAFSDKDYSQYRIAKQDPVAYIDAW